MALQTFHRPGENTASVQPSSPRLVLNFAGRCYCHQAPSVTKGHQDGGAAVWKPTASPYRSQTQLHDSRQGGQLQSSTTSCKSQHCQQQPLAILAAAQGCSVFLNSTGGDKVMARCKGCTPSAPRGASHCWVPLMATFLNSDWTLFPLLVLLQLKWNDV